jgi:hypothetical protein
MTASNIIGSVGVLLLLVAYFMSLFKFLRSESKIYGLLNVVGAALACYASVMIDYIPFVILEGMWALVALIGLFRKS